MRSRLGDYVVTVQNRGPFALPENRSPKTSDLEATVKTGSNDLTLELRK